MSTAAVICNGEFPGTRRALDMLQEASLVVACDGAAVKYMEWAAGKPEARQLPDIVIGDMDSLPPEARKLLGDRVIHVSEQEHNDQTKAVLHIATEHPEIDTIHIFGATGLREDHTVGNISLLAEYARMPRLQHLETDIISDWSHIFVLRSSCKIHLGKGRTVSFFTPDTTLRVRSKGLEWPLDDVVLDNWWKTTLNRTTAETVTLDFSHESALITVCPFE